MRRRRWLVLAMLGAATPLGAHPLVRVPAGMVPVHETTHAPDTYAAPHRVHGAAEGVTETISGTVRWQSFRGARPGMPLGAVEAIAGPLAAAGFETVLDCADTACGGFDFTLAIETLRQPAMMVNPLAFHQRTLIGRAADGAAVTISLLASRFGGMTHVQAVTVTGAPPEPAPIPEPRPAPGADPATGASAPAAAAALAATLEETGRVVLTGIDFDPAAADKALSDAPVLDHVAAMLRARPEMAVTVVGHSDNVGGLDGNIALSRARALAVVEALEARGVAAGRLSAAGAGWLAPIATNATEAGRAANRRVELVLR